MSFFGKPPDEVTETDLDALRVHGVPEGSRLEFKRDMYGRGDEDRRELLRDITAMANSRGGQILIGVDEDGDGTATTVVGVPPGDQDTWIRSLCLSSIDPRVIGLTVTPCPLANGNQVIIVDVPESYSTPHMMTFKGTNQFWIRHGREKQPMSVDEIRASVLGVLEARARMDRFMEHRRTEILDTIGSGCFMVGAALPAFFKDEELINILDTALRTLMRDAPREPRTEYTVAAGYPQPTLEGLRAEATRDRGEGEQLDKWLTVFRNGYVEFGQRLSVELHMGLVFRAREAPAYLISYSALLREIYARYMPTPSLVVYFTLFNCHGLRLLLHQYLLGEEAPWPKSHLELGAFAVGDIAAEAPLLPKRLCDRLWNAFRLDEANEFDAEGQLR
jgi:hypothetical protein